MRWNGVWHAIFGINYNYISYTHIFLLNFHFVAFLIAEIHRLETGSECLIQYKCIHTISAHSLTTGA